MSVFDLENLDLAYSPPFSSANDPVNIAGFVASHIAHGDINTVSPENWLPNGDFVLDVRDPDEVEELGKITGAINIPLTQLRDAKDKLPHNRRIVTYCQKGLRGHRLLERAAGRSGNPQRSINGAIAAAGGGRYFPRCGRYKNFFRQETARLKICIARQNPPRFFSSHISPRTKEFSGANLPHW